jgi:dUTP pyrophosphatase
MKFQKTREVKTPERGTALSAGIDFFIPEFTKGFIKDFLAKNIIPVKLKESLIELSPGESVLIPSGIKVEIPKNHVLIGFNKSGVASKLGLDVMACVIDEDYRGEIHLNLINNSNFVVQLNAGKKIVQFILMPVNYCELEEVLFIDEVSERGTGGFGSTGN